MHPILLVGAAAVGLPILLHLIMKREPKRLPFPAFRFLKVRRSVNQRKMRLRHFFLLALRMLVIALFAATLYQPKIDGSGLNLSGDRPAAAILIIDTTPSMGLKAEGKSRLDEARRRAVEFLDALPSGSRVALLDGDDPTASWEPTMEEARRKLETLKEPQGGGTATTTLLATAYRLFRNSEEEEPLPRVVAIFSDRTTESWRAERIPELKKQLEELPKPQVAQVYFDVGIEKPVDVAILAAETTPQRLPTGRVVPLAVTLRAVGRDLPSCVVRAVLDDGTPERREIPLSANSPKNVIFPFNDVKPGIHQVKVSLEADDALAMNDVRYVTFRVGEPRKILTLCDDPDDAIFWKLAHEAKGDFACEVHSVEEKISFETFDCVALLSVADPNKAGLWESLGDYLRRGGKVIVMPGPDPTAPVQYATPTAKAILPGVPLRMANKEPGVIWKVDEGALKHPLLAPFKEWLARGTIDFVVNPRRSWTFWEVEPMTPDSVVVRYDDDPDSKKASPALLERRFPEGGILLLTTTRMDSPWDRDKRWNDYWETAQNSWNVVYPHLLASYLVGAGSEPVYNHPTGRAVAVPLPKSANATKYQLEGPGVGAKEGAPEISPKQTEFVLPTERTMTPGNYLFRRADRSWSEGFSLNPPPEESDLNRLPTESIEALLGPDSVIAVGKEFTLKDLLDRRFDPEWKLFPWLMLATLVLFMVEGFFANRFYRSRAD